MQFASRTFIRFNHLVNHLVFAGLLGTAAASTMAQPASAATLPAPTAAAPSSASTPHGDSGQRMGHRDPARMQAMMAKRQADMKASLNITPAQEGAWTSFTAAMQPPAMMGSRPTPEQRAGFDKLTTPERIDNMRTLRTQRTTEMSARMDKRGEATKTFYAALTPEQKKVFDTQHQKHGPYGGHAGHGAYSSHGGHRAGAAPMRG